MDPYDAILEQLKRAQTRGLEAVTNRLDFVKESLDELVQEARSSVEEALPQEAEELFPIAELETAIGELRERTEAAESVARQLELEVSDLNQRLDAPPEQAEPAISVDLLRRLDAPRSQSELLRELLPVLVEHVGRAVVLVIRGTSISAWSGIGFVDAERLRRWQGELHESSILRQFTSESGPVLFMPAEDALFRSWLGDEPSTEACLLPVCLRGKVMGAIYTDRVDDRPWQPEIAQSLVALTCWLIDTLHYRRTVPSPMLAELRELVEEEVAAEEPEVETGEVFETPPVEEPAPTEPALEMEAEIAPELVEDITAEPVAEVEEAEVAPAEALEMEEEALPAEALETEEEALPAEAAAFDPSATVRVEVPPPPAAPVPELVPPLVEKPPPVEPVTPPEPVPEPEPEPEPEAALTPEEEARHEEARRFARLLVSEIKLYNEDEVERGRANADLYHRLKEDIDRSREMYEKRIPPEIREARDYFNDELVRILADGDSQILGM